VRSGKRAPPSPPDEPGVRALAAAFVVDPSDAWDETFFSSKFADCGRRDETCPVSTEGGTRRVQLVREGGGGGGRLVAQRFLGRIPDGRGGGHALACAEARKPLG
jgi:hypothetical protein